MASMASKSLMRDLQECLKLSFRPRDLAILEKDFLKILDKVTGCSTIYSTD